MRSVQFHHQETKRTRFLNMSAAITDMRCKYTDFSAIHKIFVAFYFVAPPFFLSFASFFKTDSHPLIQFYPILQKKMHLQGRIFKVQSGQSVHNVNLCAERYVEFANTEFQRLFKLIRINDIVHINPIFVESSLLNP